MRIDFVRKGFAIAIALIILLGTLLVPAVATTVAPKNMQMAAIAERHTAYADEYMWLSVRSAGGLTTTQNSTKEIVLSVTNTRDEKFTFDKATLEFDDKAGITFTGGIGAQTSFEKSGDTVELRFDIKTSRFCDTGMKDFRVILSNDGEVVYTSRYFALSITESVNPSDEEDHGGVYINTVDIFHAILPESGLVTGDGNEISFQIFNGSSTSLRSTQIKVTLPEGIAIDNGSNVKYLGSVKTNGTINATFPLVVEAGVEDKNYVISVEVTALDSKKEEVSFTKDFYIPVNGDGKIEEDDEAEDVHTPQLMVNNYSYGGGSVLAGAEFPLEVSFLNTSKQKLYNIKVVVESAGGTFVPVNSSNAFYIESIGAGEELVRTMVLSSAHDAEQATTAITVSMSYEDKDGETYSAQDTISVPVVQQTRLVVDDIVPPYEVYAGMEASASVDFYNMGRTRLSNLRINAEGNFDIYQSNSTYVGNLESGGKDDYRFTIIPREVGPVEGTVIFTYEDESGVEQRHEVAFTFEAMEMPVYDDPFMYEEPVTEPETIPWSLIIGGIVIVLLIAGTVVTRKILKKRKEKALELEDVAFEIDEVEETGNDK